MQNNKTGGIHANEANEKHSTTKRQNTKQKGQNQENKRKKKMCVCVSTCYLFFVSSGRGEKERGQTIKTFGGQNLKGQIPPE